jgi:hypothetical protein
MGSVAAGIAIIATIFLYWGYSWRSEEDPQEAANLMYETQLERARVTRRLGVVSLKIGWCLAGIAVLTWVGWLLTSWR